MPVTCPFCPLRCDDVVVRVAGTRVVPQGLSCPRAIDGFERASSEAERVLADAPAEQTARLAESLGQFPHVSISGTIVDINTARAAVRLAAAVGGIVDAAENGSGGSVRRAVERDGIIAATLAEVRQRADAVVVIGDATGEYPRLAERFFSQGPQKLVDRRRFLSIGSSPAEGLPAECHTHVPVTRDALHRVLAEARWALRSGRCDQNGLTEWFGDAAYVAWLWASDTLDSLAAGALRGLVAQLNDSRRSVAVPLADDTTLRSVAAWLTGLSGPVDFSGDQTQLLESAASASPTVWLQPYPTAPPPPVDREGFLAVIGLADAEVARRADLYLPAAVPGIDVAGSTIRGDGTVCLPLHAVRGSQLPAAATLLAELADRITERRRASC